MSNKIVNFDKLIKLKRMKDAKGFSFIDFDGQPCVIQKTNLAEYDTIRLGSKNGLHHRGQCLATMHLTRELAERLIDFLQCFVESGELE